MDRRSLIRNAGIAGVLAAGIAPAVHAQATVRWRMASSFPKSLDTLFGAAELFSQSVKTMSGGKFEISVHAGGELMPAFGVVDGVQAGTVEMAHTAPYYFYGKNPANLRKEFRNSLRVFLDVCEEKGINPSREFSGKFNLRIPPKLHSKIAAQATSEDKSLNQFVSEILEQSISE